MDTTISKMMKLIGLIFVAGCFTNAFEGVQSSSWGDVMGFSWGAAIICAAFTIIWTTSTNKMKAILGGKQRSDIPGSPVATTVALPAILVAISFVGGAVAAGFHGQFGDAHHLLYAGAFCCGIINIIWCVADQNYVRRSMSSQSRY